MERKLKICMGQVEVIPGNPQKNLEKLLIDYKFAVSNNADICVFSELIIPGYLLGDMWDRQSFLDECEECGKEAIASTKNNKTVMVFGNVGLDRSKKGEDGRILKYNAAFVAYNGNLIRNGGLNPYAFLSKTLLPNYREFDDSRYFSDNRKIALERGIDIRNILMPFRMPDGTMLGIGNCEDFWDGDYSIKPANILCENGADILINISCSPYTNGKNSKRNRVFGGHAKKHGKPLVYVNNVGIQNNGKNVFTFDGNSCIYDKLGMQLNPSGPFMPFAKTFDINLHEAFGKDKDVAEDISTLWIALLYGTKKYYEQNKITKVHIGASGGIDSCLQAALMVEILGAKNVYLYNMPYKFNSKTTINIAEKLAENLGTNYTSIPIHGIVDAIIVNMEKYAEANPSTKMNEKDYSFWLENVQARARLQVLAAQASALGGVFTCNANKSESTVGYCTFYADLAGFMMNLGDLWKHEIYELCHYYNKYILKNTIPEEAFNVVPSAELSENQNVDEGKGDPIIYKYHDYLFASWVERWNRATPEDNLIWYKNGILAQEIGSKIGEDEIKNLFPTVESFTKDLEKWWALYEGLAMAKRCQCPPILALKRRAFGFDLRETLGSATYTKRYLEEKRNDC